MSPRSERVGPCGNLHKRLPPDRDRVSGSSVCTSRGWKTPGAPTWSQVSPWPVPAEGQDAHGAEVARGAPSLTYSGDQA